MILAVDSLISCVVVISWKMVCGFWAVCCWLVDVGCVKWQDVLWVLCCVLYCELLWVSYWCCVVTGDTIGCVVLKDWLWFVCSVLLSDVLCTVVGGVPSLLYVEARCGVYCAFCVVGYRQGCCELCVALLCVINVFSCKMGVLVAVCCSSQVCCVLCLFCTVGCCVLFCNMCVLRWACCFGCLICCQMFQVCSVYCLLGSVESWSVCKRWAVGLRER